MYQEHKPLVFAAVNGPFKTDLPKVVNKSYIPLNILSDLCTEVEFRQGITNDFDLPELINWLIRRCQSRTSQLSYKLSFTEPGTKLHNFNGYVGIEDFGFLTRHLPLVQVDSWIIEQWKQAGWTMTDYIKFVLQFSTELDALIRSVFPRAGIIACETFDISHHTAIGTVPPHPHFLQRWRRVSRSLRNLPFVIGTSVYRTNQTHEEYTTWVERQRSFADVAYIMPQTSAGGVVSVEQFQETFDIVSEVFDKIFIWARPQSADQAALIRALVGAIVLP